jgi:hypothetical protein
MPFLTAIGLAVPAGLNAYIPLLTVAIATRAGYLKLASPYDALGSWWAIGVIVVLLLIEIVADKIPAVDSVNDIIQTFVRPAAGGIVFVAASGQSTNIHPALLIVAGIILAGGTHAAKAAARPVVHATTAGTGGPVVSVAEDVVAVISSVVAIFAPVLVVLVLVVLAVIAWRLVARRRARDA